MSNFSDPFFWLNFLYFFVAISIAFVIPGWVILKKIDLSPNLRLILGTTVGMVLFAWQALLFGYLNLRWLSYIYLLIFLLLFLIELFKTRPKLDLKLPRIDWVIFVIIAVGVVTQLSAVWYTGVEIGDILYFCCGEVRDNILNLAITNEVIKNMPPFEPGYYGKLITNYHYWSSIVIGELVRIFKLPLAATNFQYMTLVVSVLLGLNAWAASEALRMGKAFKRWLLLFLYFGADLVWAFVLFFRGQQIFEMQAMESGPKFLENLPRAFAVVALLAGLSLFVIWIKKKDIKLSIIIGLVFAALVGFKIYLALFILPGLLLLALYYVYKKEYRALIMICASLVLGAIIYIPINAGAGGLFFTGTWRFENFVVQPYLGEINRLELARVIYLEHNNWIRVVGYELLYILIFVVATFGLKLLGFFQSKKSLLSYPFEFNVVLITGVITSSAAGALFNQSSGGANTFNFLVSVFIFGSFYTALALSYWTQKIPKVLLGVVIIIVLVLTLPRGIDQTYKNIKNVDQRKGFFIAEDEMDGIRKLKEINTESLVIVDPTIKMDYETPYVGLLSNQKIFLSGQGNELEAHGIDFSDRKRALNSILHSEDPSVVGKNLLKYNIGYMFMKNGSNLVATKSAAFFDIIFQNKKVKILKVNNQNTNDFLQKMKNV